ncbi:MAG: hypothetical protein GKR96_11790 [Gammaproteobacteria bacterium]|nr:hypothetical protein [Gammaproteobacteria bacterium]
MKFIAIFAMTMAIVLVGCNETNTSSSTGNGGGEVFVYSRNIVVSASGTDITIPTSAGGNLYVWYSGGGTSSDPLIMKVNIRDMNNNPIAGTIHWQDNTDDRVYNGSMFAHVYHTAGNYRIAVELDGGEKIPITAGTTITVWIDNTDSAEVGCIPSTFFPC